MSSSIFFALRSARSPVTASPHRAAKTAEIGRVLIKKVQFLDQCPSQECGWGSWTTPAAAHEPVGVYRNPWFMTYANAEKRWKHVDE